MEKIKIVTDSSADLTRLEGGEFDYSPLRIITKDKEFTDDNNLDVASMVEYLNGYRGKSSTSCPNTSDWLRAFGDAKYIICITITATLSGCYNAAMAAKDTYEKEHPDRKVFVLNSLTAGPHMRLLIEKAHELIKESRDFVTVCKETAAYYHRTGLVFMLESMNNLANNGRVSPLVAKAAGLLGIRVVGKASDQGDLEPLDKCRGQEKSLNAMIKRMIEMGFSGGKVFIDHCENETAAQKFKQMIQEKIKGAKIEINKCRGLCSFYAEKGGMLVGFEKA
ncbi:MAG: DegV family protein [Ruminococcus sp.]|nr:DegV family protein [Ruminococcus sp.]